MFTGEMRSASGRPRHCNEMRTRYALGLVAPCSELPTFKANKMEELIMVPILFRPNQTATRRFKISANGHRNSTRKLGGD